MEKGSLSAFFTFFAPLNIGKSSIDIGQVHLPDIEYGPFDAHMPVLI
jgi:hypothetical protein